LQVLRAARLARLCRVKPWHPERAELRFPVPKDDKDISITRAVGQFFGHLWSSSTKPVANNEPKRRVVNRETTDGEGIVDGRTVTLRRTTIDEIEIREDEPKKD